MRLRTRCHLDCGMSLARFQCNAITQDVSHRETHLIMPKPLPKTYLDAGNDALALNTCYCLICQLPTQIRVHSKPFPGSSVHRYAANRANHRAKGDVAALLPELSRHAHSPLVCKIAVERRAHRPTRGPGRHIVCGSQAVARIREAESRESDTLNGRNRSGAAIGCGGDATSQRNLGIVSKLPCKGVLWSSLYCPLQCEAGLGDGK